MVRLLLEDRSRLDWRSGPVIAGLIVFLAVFVVMPATVPVEASKHSKQPLVQPPPPDLLMDGGRKLSFERSFSLER